MSTAVQSSHAAATSTGSADGHTRCTDAEIEGEAKGVAAAAPAVPPPAVDASPPSTSQAPPTKPTPLPPPGPSGHTIPPMPWHDSTATDAGAHTLGAAPPSVPPPLAQRSGGNFHTQSRPRAIQRATANIRSVRERRERGKRDAAALLADQAALPASIFPASVAASHQRAASLATDTGGGGVMCGGEGGGWCFPWVQLTKADEQVLFDLHIQFKIREPQVCGMRSPAALVGVAPDQSGVLVCCVAGIQTLIAACSRLEHLVLRDFPPEVVLQYPSLVYHLISALQMPLSAVAPPSDATTSDIATPPTWGTVFGAARTAIHSLLAGLARAVAVVRDPELQCTRSSQDTTATPHVGVDRNGVEAMHYPAIASAAPVSGQADAVSAEQRMSVHEAARAIICGSAPLLKDASRLASVVGLIRSALPLLLQQSYRSATAGSSSPTSVDLGVWHLDQRRLESVLGVLGDCVDFYRDELCDLAAVPPSVQPLVQCVLDVVALVPPSLLQSDGLGSEPPSPTLATVPTPLVQLLAGVVMHEPMAEALPATRTDVMPYLQRLDARSSAEFVHAGVVLVALQQARTLPRLLAGSGAELPPIARALRALETLPTVLEALLYVPQPTVVRLAVWACLVVGAAAPLRDTEATAADGSTAVAASDVETARSVLLRLLAFPGASPVAVWAYEAVVAGLQVRAAASSDGGDAATGDADDSDDALFDLCVPSREAALPRCRFLLSAEVLQEVVMQGLAAGPATPGSTDTEAAARSSVTTQAWLLLLTLAEMSCEALPLLHAFQPFVPSLQALLAYHRRASSQAQDSAEVPAAPTQALRTVAALLALLREQSSQTER